MAETFSLAVWCAEPAERFDTRKFHFVRRDALHAVLDTCDCIRVLDWGRTDDKFKHEIVDLVIEACGGSASASVPALAYAARALANDGASAECVAAVTALLERLAPKQAAGEIDAVHLHLLSNNVLILHPAGIIAQTTILQLISPDGSIIDLPYEASESDLAAL